jgi:hypothetical protein
MQRSFARWLLPAVLVVPVLLVVAFGPRRASPATSPLDDWDFTKLVAHLNRAGLGMREVSTQKNGVIGNAVFLTTTDKEWDDFNRLTKDPRRIAEWQGILYCECVKGRNPWLLTSQWGEDCLVAGPFLFYGDHKLLAQVRAALADAEAK